MIIIIYLDRQLEGIDDAMKLGDATLEIVKEAMKRAEDEVYFSKVKLSEKKRRELDVMGDAALSLRHLELENEFSYQERG